jgi:preprotein translocase subunit SecG
MISHRSRARETAASPRCGAKLGEPEHRRAFGRPAAGRVSRRWPGRGELNLSHGDVGWPCLAVLTEVHAGRAATWTIDPDEDLEATVVIALSLVLIVTSSLLVLLVLLHKGKGGGLSDLFGGGMSASLGGSSVVERNLDRITYFIGVVWAASIIALGLLLKNT